MPSWRRGTRLCVIVPSRDSAPGSSDKPYWLGGSGEDVAALKAELEALEAAFSREAPEPDYRLAQQQHEAQHDGTNPHAHAAPGVAAPRPSGLASSEAAEVTADVDSLPDAVLRELDLDPAQLRERLASAALASTSAPAASAASAVGAGPGRSARVGAAAAGTAAPAPSGSGSGSSTSSPSHDIQHGLSQREHEQRQPAGHPGLNGSHLNGASLNGVHLNGTPLNGVHLNGASLNGSPHANGTSLNGTSLHGSSCGASAPAPAPAAADTPAPTAAPAPPALAPAASPPAPDTSIPGSIWILCCISAALTCASCVFNTALPIYMVSELKMSMRSMGMFEGLLEAFSYVVRMCSGVVSDRMASRKAAITLGFAAGAAAKLGMASAGSVGLLFAGKAVDRLANGIQAAPRDALIGDLSPPGVRSACFGLAQSLRKWGSAVGALAAFFLMKASNNNYQLIFYSAAAVSLTATAAFVTLVPAHTRTQQQRQQAPLAPASAQAAHPAQPASGAASSAAAAAAAAGDAAPSGVSGFLRSVASMGSDFYRMLGVICLYAMGHINESLLEARAMEVGFGKAEATLVVAALAGVTFLTAFPLGRLDDRFGAGTTFAVGIGALIAGDLVLLLSGTHPMALFAACAFLGVHWAVIQGPLLSIVSGLAPPQLRGTAFGIFYTVMAFTAVAANTMYGTIWHTYGANAAFATSAGLMSLVLAALPHLLPRAAQRGGAAAAPALVPPVVKAGGKLGGSGGLAAAPLPAAA